MSKMLAINGSPRNDGSTAAVLNAAAERLEQYGVESEMINLGDLRISHCTACMNCKRTGSCAIDDDMTKLYGMIRDADIIIFGTPIYFGSETGLFKNFLDRLYAMISVRDGVREADIGKPKKGSVVMTCGAPDGHMAYHGVGVHMIGVMRSFGINDVSSAIIPCGVPDTVSDSDFFRDYMDAIDFQMM